MVRQSFWWYGLVFKLQSELVDAVVGGGMNRYTGSHFGKVIWMRYADNLDLIKLVL